MRTARPVMSASRARKFENTDLRRSLGLAWCSPVVPALRRLRRKGLEFKARVCLKK